MSLQIPAVGPFRRGSPRPRRSRTGLAELLARVRRRTGEPGDATIRSLIAALGPDASALVALVVAVPFLSPVSLGALTAPASLLIGIQGWRMLSGRRRLRLPDRVLDVTIPAVVERSALGILRLLHRYADRVCRSRLGWLVESRGGEIVCGAGLISGAVLLAIPIPFLPLTNTLPAIGILCFAIGWIERDGLVTLLGCAALAMSAALFALLGFGAAAAGGALLERVISVLP